MKIMLHSLYTPDFIILIQRYCLWLVKSGVLMPHGHCLFALEIAPAFPV